MTGRGLGRHFAQQLLARGATVYGGARNTDSIDVPGLIPVAIDVTDAASVAAAADTARGVSLLINNAGSFTGASFLDDIRLEMETHYFGTLGVTRAFAAQLAAAGGGAVLNVLSALSWVTLPAAGAYSAAKSAEWSLTNALRLELAAQGTLVTALHVGFMDTDMAAHVDGPKSDPASVAKLALEAVQAGEIEILADDVSRQVQAGLAGGAAALYPALAGR